MSKRLSIFFFFFLSSSWGMANSSTSISVDKRQELCPQIILHASETLRLSAAEKKLICGDDSQESWQMIPHNQAMYVLARVLEDRGYLRHHSKVVDGTLIVEAGEKTAFADLTILESPLEISTKRFWYPWGKSITSDLLNYIETFILDDLAARGHPCVTLDTYADVNTGKVVIKVHSKGEFLVKDVRSPPLPRVRHGVIERFNAFREGEPYDRRKFTLTSSRLVASELVASSRFIPNCENPEKGLIDHRHVEGRPKMISIGFGFDTEQFAIAQAIWRNSRFTEGASPLRAQAYTSFTLQRFNVGSDVYYLPFSSRHYLDLQFAVSRRHELRYEEGTIQIAALPSWSIEHRSSQMQIAFGPSWSHVRTFRGFARDDSRLVAMQFSLRQQSHDWEFYQMSPRSGYQTSLLIQDVTPALGSNVAARSYDGSATVLTNLLGYEPSIYVLGFRGRLATTSPYDKSDFEEIPSSLRYWLGGVENLRGFPRERLPGDARGAHSIGYLGAELRVNEVLPWGMQPFFFYDFGLLGFSPFSLDQKTRYSSPGLGLRYESPFGPMRLTMGHGVVQGEKAYQLEHLERWQFYFSFGGHF